MRYKKNPAGLPAYLSFWRVEFQIVSSAWRHVDVATFDAFADHVKGNIQVDNAMENGEKKIPHYNSTGEGATQKRSSLLGFCLTYRPFQLPCGASPLEAKFVETLKRVK